MHHRMSLKIAIFQPEPDGHHLVYVRYILGPLLAAGHTVTLVTTDRVIESVAFEMIKERFEGQFTTVKMEDVPTPESAGIREKLKGQFGRWKAYHKAYLSLPKQDAIFMVNLDRADHAMAVKGSPFGPSSFTGFLFGRHFHLAGGARNAIEKISFKRLLRIPSLKSILVVDPEFAESQKGSIVRFIPDAAYIEFVDTERSLRRELGIRPEQRVCLMFGSLTPRKGVAEFLSALDSPECHQDVVGLLVGKQDDDIQQLLRENQATRLIESGRLFVLPGFADNEVQSMAFTESDCVWAGYIDWLGGSGVLVQAAASGKPILANTDGHVGKEVLQNGLGLAVDILSPEKTSQALDLLTSQAEQYKDAGLAYAKDRTIESFAKSVVESIEGCAQ